MVQLTRKFKLHKWTLICLLFYTPGFSRRDLHKEGLLNLQGQLQEVRDLIYWPHYSVVNKQREKPYSWAKFLFLMVYPVTKPHCEPPSLKQLVSGSTFLSSFFFQAWVSCQTLQLCRQGSTLDPDDGGSEIYVHEKAQENSKEVLWCIMSKFHLYDVLGIYTKNSALYVSVCIFVCTFVCTKPQGLMYLEALSWHKNIQCNRTSLQQLFSPL